MYNSYTHHLPLVPYIEQGLFVPSNMITTAVLTFKTLVSVLLSHAVLEEVIASIACFLRRLLAVLNKSIIAERY